MNMRNKQAATGWLLTTRTAWKFAGPWRKWFLLAVAINLLCALFEGGSLGMITVALQVLGGPQDLSKELQWLQDKFGQERLFLGLVLLAIFSQALRAGFQFLGVALTAGIRPRVQIQATRQIYSRILELPFPRASAYRLGDLTDYLQQPVYLSEALGRVNDLIRTALFLAVYALVLFRLSWPLTLAALAAYAVVSRLMETVMRRVARYAMEVRRTLLTLTQAATESFQALRTLHSFGRLKENLRETTELLEQQRQGQWRTLLWVNAPEPVTDLLAVAGIGFFLVAGYLLLGPGKATTLPSLLAFLVAMHRVTPRLRALYTYQAVLANLAPNIARMNEILAVESPKETGGKPFQELCRSIEFQGVGLRYLPEEPPAVSDLTFSLPRGGFTALVGLSGTGKSTVADLLLRLYEPTDGVIRVDETPLSALDRQSWLDRVGSVAQDPFLFHASIRDNILFGKPDATEEEILSAGRSAHADGFIQKSANGYGTVVGERGQRLSGGEAQRVALARALIRQPDVLILDEATSALDSDSERQIRQALEEQRGRRTLLVIAHRLSTVAHADQILVLAEGRLVERGTHQELIARGGIYAHLWKLQSEVHGAQTGVPLRL